MTSELSPKAADPFEEVENLKTYDPFADVDEGTGDGSKARQNIHIRIRQRNGKKCWTIVQGIQDSKARKWLLKDFKKTFACNGTLFDDDVLGSVIQIQGDHRKKVREQLATLKAFKDTEVTMHGF